MTKKLTKKQLGGGNYISPEIKTVEFKAEGPLCLSFSAFGAANHAGKDLTETDEFTWDF